MFNWYNSTIGTTSNKIGEFEITDSLVGILHFSHIGFNNAEININNSDSNLFVVMSRNIKKLDQITIKTKEINPSKLLNKLLEKYSTTNNTNYFLGQVKQRVLENNEYKELLVSDFNFYQKNSKTKIKAPYIERILNIKESESYNFSVSIIDLINLTNLHLLLNNIKSNLKYFDISTITTFLDKEKVLKLILKLKQSDLQSKIEIFIEKKSLSIIRVNFFDERNSINTDKKNNTINIKSSEGYVIFRPLKNNWIVSKVYSNLKSKIKNKDSFLIDRIDEIEIIIKKELSKNLYKGKNINLKKDLTNQFDINIPSKLPILLTKEIEFVNLKK